MEWIFGLLMGCIGAAILFIAVLVTIWIETPTIIKGGITRNKKYIAAVNSITNTVFNVGLVIITIMRFNLYGHTAILVGWYILGELLLIPLSEILAYKAISKAPFKKIVIFTYIANLESFLLGAFIGFFVFGSFF